MLTKIDGLDDEIVAHQTERLRSVVAQATPIYAISSLAKTGVKDLLRLLVKKVRAERQRQVELEKNPSVDTDQINEVPIIELGTEALADKWQVTKIGEIFQVTGKKIERFSRRTDYTNWEGVNRLRDIMRKNGITRELIKQGAIGGSLVKIGDDPEFTLEEVS